MAAASEEQLVRDLELHNHHLTITISGRQAAATKRLVINKNYYTNYNAHGNTLSEEDVNFIG